jgi:hypothetical protein
MARTFNEATEVAVAIGTRTAVRMAATIDFATITAITGKTVTLNLADGSSVPNVNVLHPYVPRVGAIVRVASQGSILVVLGGLGVSAATEIQASSVSSFSVTATALSPLPVTPLVAAFVVPRSGSIVCHIKARMTPSTTARAYASVRVMNGATVVASYTPPLIEVPAGGGTFSLGAHWMFTGLTPAASLTAELVAASGTAGQTVTVAYPVLLVQPIS